jgi:hypothetical protein
MIEVKTERIWTLSRNDKIVPRIGEVCFDIDEIITDTTDAKRAITITKGLRPRDFAVFLSFPSFDLDKEDTADAGYLVGDVDASDGSGVIVHGDKVEQCPKDWATGRIMDTWAYLETIEPNIFDDFTLKALGEHIRKRNNHLI